MATAVLARVERQSLRGKEYKQAHKARMAELLKRRWFGYTRLAVVLDVLKLFPPVYIVANSVVKGVYDFAWETGVNLYLFGGLLIITGIAVPWWRIRRAQKKRYRTSPGTWKFVGLLVVLLGLSYICSAVILHVSTNYDMWHAIAPNKEMRDDFGRNGLEGVYTGLLWTYVRWDPVKYQLKGTPADQLFKKLRWPNSLQSDEECPLRTWMMWVCFLLMAILAGAVLFGFWNLNNFVTSNADTIHHWFRDAIPWHVHSPAPKFLETKVNHVANVATDKWWVWIAGFIGGSYLARMPAKGIINILQEDSVQRRLSKKGGVLEKAFSWWRSLGWNAHLAQVYYDYAEHRLDLSDATIAEIEEALAEVPQEEIDAVYGAIAESAQAEVDGRDPGIMIPLKLLVFLSPVFFLLGIFFVYFPLLNHLLHTHLPVLTHS